MTNPWDQFDPKIPPKTRRRNIRQERKITPEQRHFQAKQQLVSTLERYNKNEVRKFVLDLSVRRALPSLSVTEMEELMEMDYWKIVETHCEVP